MVLENQEWVNEVASGDYQKYYEEMYGNKQIKQRLTSIMIRG